MHDHWTRRPAVLLRIVVWNAAMALHKKVAALAALRPTIAILPECAAPAILRTKAPTLMHTQCVWEGRLRDKGLGVFAFGDYTLRRSELFDPRFEVFVPIEVRGAHNFNLLAVWAFNHRTSSEVGDLPAPTRAALNHYRPFLTDGWPSVVAGDFNHHVRWDKPGSEGNFAAIATDLQALGLESAYHRHHDCSLGGEKHATHFFRRSSTELYHIDYCFLPREWMTGLQDVAVGSAGDWISLSDHAPIVVDIRLRGAARSTA
jgi:hypothetical protein